ncbi:uncharacterized protein ACRADG_009018 isoform 2-T2 [Cochliomyia hominivorax]
MFHYLKLLILLIITTKCIGNNFILVANENSFFQPCNSKDNSGNVYVDDLLEINLKHEYADDMETLITNGNITVKFEMPEDLKLMLDLEVYEWKRGKWEKTIYSIRRDDLCKAAFDPPEFWYPLVMQIPEEERICPPPKGYIYHLNDVKNVIELNNVVGLDIEGQYKIIAHFIVEDYSTCMTSVINIWKN